MAEEVTRNEPGDSETMMCMIYSGWCLEELDKFISKYGTVMYIKIVRDRDGKETRRTQALISQATYKALCADGYGDTNGADTSTDPKDKRRGLRATPYVIYPHDLPGKGKTSSLFVPIPRELSFNPSAVETGVTDKLNQMVEYGIIQEASWRINVTFRSRETGEVSGCYITFQNDVDPKTITMVRILINDTFWPTDSEDETIINRRPIFRCFWARAKVQHPKRYGQPHIPKYNRSIRMTEQNIRGIISGFTEQIPPLGGVKEDILLVETPEQQTLGPVQSKTLGPQPVRL